MRHHPFPIVIALGSNLGPGPETLTMACRLLERAGVGVKARSRIYRSRPWGVTDQPVFYNAAISVKSGLHPRALLDRCLNVEGQLGRRRRECWGPRRLDLDLILYGNARIEQPGLQLPHPHVAKRDFVLVPMIDLGIPPLAAIAPRGWGALLHALPAAERTLVHAMPWSLP